MWTSILLVVCLLGENPSALQSTVHVGCPTDSFFYDGACYSYLPAEGVSADQAAIRCRAVHAHLWDIETTDELTFVLDRIDAHIQPFDRPRIAVNFTHGRQVLQLPRRLRGQDEILLRSNENYAMIYRPSMNGDALVTIEISKAARRISLLEKSRFERRCNHFICKRKIHSCDNQTNCGQHRKWSPTAVRSILGLLLVALACCTVLVDLLCDYPAPHSSMRTNDSHTRVYSISNPQQTDDSGSSLDSSMAPTPSPSHTIVHVRRPSIQPTCRLPRPKSFASLWPILIGLMTIAFASLCCQTVYQFKIEHFKTLANRNDTTSPMTHLCRVFQLNFSFYFQIPTNYISLALLVLLVLMLTFFENFSKRKLRSSWYHFSMPMVFNGHSHAYRFESAAVFGLLALEILHIFDEFIVNGAKHFQQGPLIDLVIQFTMGLLLGLRYFPILAIFERENRYSHRLGNVLCYALATMYLYCELLFKLQSDMNCATNKSHSSTIREMTEKFTQMGMNIQEYLSLQAGANQNASTNDTHFHNQLWLNAHMNTSTYDDRSDLDNDLTRLNDSLELNRQSIFYNTVRYAPYYYYIVFLAVRLTLMFLNACLRRTKDTALSCARSSPWNYVKCNLLDPPARIDQSTFNCLHRFFHERVYSPRPYFRYSKLIVCIYTTAFTLIYYFTFWIQDHTYILTKKLLLFLNLILCTLANLSTDLCYDLNLHQINRDVKYICLLTALITCLQLLFGLKHYQAQMCRAYRGVFQDIPTAKQISSLSMISKSIHYPGRFIGSLIYSYGFLFLFVSIVYILSRYLLYSLILLELFAKLLLPMIVFVFFQFFFIRLLCMILFVDNAHLFGLRNLRLYYTLSYFSFFFDCFLGFLTCVTRISKAFVCALVFFARLDYSPYGRGLELYDSSYASYVSYFHMEKNQRHPVLNVFIDIVCQRLMEIRRYQLKLPVDSKDHHGEQERRARQRRFRWALAYTLIRNERLKGDRKHRLHSTKASPSRTLERLFDRLGLSHTLPRTA